MNHIPLRASLILIGAAIAGCSSTPVTTPTAGSTASSTSASAGAMGATGATGSTAQAGQSSVATVSTPAYLEPTSPIASQRSVYFGFDDYTVNGEYQNVVETHGKYLMNKPALRVKVEGNADERGGAEYNLALGQRRAEAVLKSLEIYGVKRGQLEATSWGSERPKSTGHDETAWAQNRRADLVYPKQ